MPGRARITEVGIVPAGRSFSQLGILVLDSGEEMGEPAEGTTGRARTVSHAVREMVARFKLSPYRRNFFFAVVAVGEGAGVHTPITPAERMDDGADYDPTRGHGGPPHVGEGLRVAQGIAAEFLRTAPAYLVSSVVIVVASGGGDADPPRTLRIAREIRRNAAITICSAYLAGPDDPEREAANHLRSLASHPRTGFRTISEAGALREFLIASVASGTKLAI